MSPKSLHAHGTHTHESAHTYTYKKMNPLGETHHFPGCTLRAGTHLTLLLFNSPRNHLVAQMRRDDSSLRDHLQLFKLRDVSPLDRRCEGNSNVGNVLDDFCYPVGSFTQTEDETQL